MTNENIAANVTLDVGRRDIYSGGADALDHYVPAYSPTVDPICAGLWRDAVIEREDGVHVGLVGVVPCIPGGGAFAWEEMSIVNEVDVHVRDGQIVAVRLTGFNCGGDTVGPQPEISTWVTRCLRYRTTVTRLLDVANQQWADESAAARLREQAGSR